MSSDTHTQQFDHYGYVCLPALPQIVALGFVFPYDVTNVFGPSEGKGPIRYPQYVCMSVCM